MDNMITTVQHLVREAIKGGYYTGGLPARVMLPIDQLQRLGLADNQDVARLYRELADYEARNNPQETI